MRPQLATIALMAAALSAAMTAAPAAAQTVPEGQSCGGLFCDLGIVGHKVAPAPPPDAAPPPAEPRVVAAPAVVVPDPVAPEPKKKIVHKPKRVARAAPAPGADTPAASPAPPRKTAGPAVSAPAPANAPARPSAYDMFMPIYQ